MQKELILDSWQTPWTEDRTVAKNSAYAGQINTEKNSDTLQCPEPDMNPRFRFTFLSSDLSQHCVSSAVEMTSVNHIETNQLYITQSNM
jgi:hypothetical protein